MIGIYKITNNINNKIYIGQSGRLEDRLSSHKRLAFNPNHKQYDDELYKDIRKYGVDNFSFEILETISLDKLEEKWIQKYSFESSMYNKNMHPYSNEHHYSKIFSNDDIDKVIKMLKDNEISNIKIAETFNCSPTTIDNINNGKVYRKEDQQYPIRDFKPKGEKNANAKYTDEEVLNIRKAFKSCTLKELFDKYSKSSSYKSFERMVTGKSYCHVPIYKKREDKWYKDNMQYRLEP